MTSIRIMVILASAVLAGCGGGGETVAGPASTATAADATSGPPATTTSHGATSAKSSKRHEHRTAKPYTTAAPSSSSSTGSGGGDRSIQTFGTRAAPSEKEAVAAAVLAYDRAVADGDTAAACNGLASPIRTQLLQMLSRTPKRKGLTCPKLLTAMFATIAPRLRTALRATTITEVRIEGDRGFALFHQPGVRAGSFPVVREHGTWKVAAISGSNLP